MNKYPIVLSSILLCLSLPMIFVPAFAQTSSNPIVFPSSASYYKLGPYNSIQVPIQNVGSQTLVGVVIAVIHNSIGQTLQISSSTRVLAPGQTGTGYQILSVPSGTYSIDIFVWSISGSSLSAKQTISVSF